MTQVPSIDYEQHPAYASLRARVPPPDKALDSMVEEIDRRYMHLARDLARTLHARQVAYRQELAPRFDELARAVIRQPGVRPELAAYAEKAIGLARGYLHDALEAEERSAELAVGGGSASRALQDLRDNGYSRLARVPDLAHGVWRQTWWERSVLRSRAQRSPGRHCVEALHPHSPAVELIRRYLRNSGALAAASSYLGKPMEFLYAALDHAHPRQNWYANCYQDAGIPTSRTAYMHFDADHDMMKAMLYLQDVGPGNGPFGYVRGSHAWRRSPVQCALQKGFDQAQAGLFDLEADGLDFKLGYYRPRFKLLEYRADQLALPASLRGSTHFGDDVQDDSELSRFLLNREELFTGPAGCVVLFDGSRGIHRGALATAGVRWAVQIGLRVRKNGAAGDSSVRRSLRDRLSYHKHRAKTFFRTLWDGPHA